MDSFSSLIYISIHENQIISVKFVSKWCYIRHKWLWMKCLHCQLIVYWSNAYWNNINWMQLVLKLWNVCIISGFIRSIPICTNLYFTFLKCNLNSMSCPLVNTLCPNAEPVLWLPWETVQFQSYDLLIFFQILLGLLSFKYGYENIGRMKFICCGVLYFIL